MNVLTSLEEVDYTATQFFIQYLENYSLLQIA